MLEAGSQPPCILCIACSSMCNLKVYQGKSTQCPPRVHMPAQETKQDSGFYWLQYSHTGLYVLFRGL